MGESACLMRSFSHPANASREIKEGDPLRALTESISFGRFMSESLAWEKWSTFSHNRYLEEVEQFSKPGSVAEKKAYFEAHYKKRAADKAAAAALLNQANVAVNNIAQVETMANNLLVADTVPKTENDSPISSVSGEATNDAVIDKQQEKDVLEIAHSPDASVTFPDGEKGTLRNATMESAEEQIQGIFEAENPALVENPKQLDNANDYDSIVATAEEKMPDEDDVEKENVALPSNKRPMNLSPRLLCQDRAAKLPKSSTRQPSSLQLKGGTIANANAKKSLGDLTDRRKLAPKSVHMSINLAPRTGETGKSSAQTSKESSARPKIPTRASVSGVAKLFSSINRSSEDKRNPSLLNKSVAGGTIAGGILQAISGIRAKSSNSSGSKTRSSIISSPFSFRSEERAAKRKEFFQKLGEKNNSKEAEKTHVPVKSKVPLTRPRSPKLGRKPSSNVTQETSIPLPRRPSTNTESYKRIVPKANQSMTRSVAALPKKKAHENASPNIQH